MNKKGGVGSFILGVLLILIVLVALFEVCLLAYAYTNADEVECNLFWCTFKKTNVDIIQTVKCELNNEEVNCSDLNSSAVNKFYNEYLKP